MNSGNTELELYSDIGGQTGHGPLLNDSFVLNPNCWMAGIDASGIPVGVTSVPGGVNYYVANCGALITPQHVIGIRHFPSFFYTKGVTKFKFRGSDGTIHIRTVIGVCPRDGGIIGEDGIGDELVCTLDSPLPSTVKPMSIAPQSWFVQDKEYLADKPATPYGSRGIKTWIGSYAVSFDQYFKASVMQIGNNDGTYQTFVYHGTINGNPFEDNLGYTRYISVGQGASAPPFLVENWPWAGVLIKTGDSGMPVMMVIGGDLVLVSCFTTVVNGAYHGSLDGWHLNQQILLSDADASVSTLLEVGVSGSP